MLQLPECRLQETRNAIRGMLLRVQARLSIVIRPNRSEVSPWCGVRLHRNARVTVWLYNEATGAADGCPCYWHGNSDVADRLLLSNIASSLSLFQLGGFLQTAISKVTRRSALVFSQKESR